MGTEEQLANLRRSEGIRKNKIETSKRHREILLMWLYLKNS